MYRKMFGGNGRVEGEKTRTRRKKDGVDLELEDVLIKLKKLQEKVGGGPKTERPEVTARGGVGADEFLDLKEVMMLKLKSIRVKVGEDSSSLSAREQIQRDTENKQARRQLVEDWKCLEALHKEKKRKKKRTEEEEGQFKDREDVLAMLITEIEDVKEAQRGYSRVRGAGSGGFKSYLTPQANHELFDRSTKREQEEVSSEQQQRLMALKERDAQFDSQIGEIGVGIDELGEIAKNQQEEVKRHQVMVQDLGTRIDAVHDHLENVNVRMKTTLDDVSRDSGKLCVDLMCLMLTVGLCVIFYKLAVS